ncbi:dTDP-4-amino-4,6-dideoxygalactose transaminase [Palleronia marisminoris]|uniref:UDP-2-acetamido-2-deoxy-3-oxo-D-glucuronate aminotransferase n=1 Tax=Palleronia marisminoris TaxID=315423 RepID=A0A1Y5SSC7_9RHOB|nr:DegT/DnrJ/EryC1/StrS aminotransferase family protein [Palleronia marisminoris]SFG89452.1 dTDP-4-amino-4,6-dideoxygalactose transaminase [Palleronia marisminoris]SLN44055.1 UDP-2-acetamido-2-deoxy-3-oxo-D-glucuronate aminotransferase [Palleronia marisminoris]
MQFIDLAAQQARLRSRIDERIARVLDHGIYIMGPEVGELEERLATFCGASHCISCANGTDALQLALMALGTGPGDAVFVPSFTFAATAEVVPFVGATPVFTDIDLESYTMSPDSLERAVRHARREGLRPAAVMPVDLFGRPADYDALSAVAAREGMKVVADSAQGWGATYRGRMTGTLGTITTTSFFPAKPLGCYGDGGAMFTEDADLAAALDSFRIHGKGREKYDNVRIGMNSRLDTIQAAILLEKLQIYAEESEARQAVAARYTAALSENFVAPKMPRDILSIWAQYTLLARDAERRNSVLAALRSADIPAVIYYPRPLHRLPAYEDFPRDPHGLAASELAASCVFSVPMSPYLQSDDQDRIISVLQAV